MTVLELQKLLSKKGFDPGPLDGIAGPKTREAVRKFQASQGLDVDGIVGPKTMAKLLGTTKPQTAQAIETATATGDVSASMPWMAEAKRLIGTTETPGAANNPVIMDWARQQHIGYEGDSTPWCGLFVSNCVGATLPNEPIPENPLGARNWLKFGDDVSPQFGAVLVFWRVAVNSWLGHVGFYWSEDDTYFHVLAGNQSDAVNIQKHPKSKLLGARWPSSVPAPGLRRMMTGTQLLRMYTEDA